jgi:hypothetical protein
MKMPENNRIRISRKFLLSTFILLIIVSCGQRDSSYSSVIDKAGSLLEEYPDSALTILYWLNEKDLSDPEKALYNLTKSAAFYESNIKQSDLAITRAISFYEKKKDKERLMQSYYYMGAISEDNGDVMQAQNYLLKALDIAESFENDLFQGRINDHIGKLYVRQEMYENSIPYFKKAISVSRKEGDSELLAYSLRDLARAYSCLNGSIDSALVAYEEAFALSNDKMRLSMLSEMGSLYTKLGEYDKAYVLLQQALANEESLEDKNSVYISYGALLFEVNRLDSARYYMNEVLFSTKIDAIQEAYNYLILIEKKDGNLKKMSELFEYYHIVRARNEEEKRSEIIAYMENLYSYNKLEKELADSSLKHTKQRMASGVIFVIILFVCIMLFYFIYQKNREIKSQKERFRNWEERFRRKSDEKMFEQLIHSEIYRKFHNGGAIWTPNSQDWNELSIIVDKTYNNFTYNLKELLPSLTEMELMVSYLIKIGISPGRIAVFLNTSMQGISMTRSRMYEKITKEKGSTVKFDEFIAKL